MARARFAYSSYSKSEDIILAVPVEESEWSRNVKVVTDKERGMVCVFCVGVQEDLQVGRC
jgi:hypothetical protein